MLLLSSEFDHAATHVVVPMLRRNDKTMSGMSAGAWIVSSEYIHECGREDDLVDEHAFELSKADTGVISEGEERNRPDWCKSQLLGSVSEG